MRLRIGYSIGAIAMVTLALIPFQWLAVRFAHPARRRIPFRAFYHRIVCRL